MNVLLKTTAGAVALLAGAGIAMAEGEKASTSASMTGMDMTCADVANLEPQEAERALYFLAGLQQGQNASRMSQDSAAAMPNANSDSTDPDVTQDTAASTMPGAASGDAAGSASGSAASPSDMAAATPPRGDSVSPSQGNNTAAGNLPGDQGQAAAPSQDMAANPLPGAEQGSSDAGQSSQSSQDMAASPATPDQSGQAGQAGQSDMAQGESAGSTVDPTVTAGVSGSGTGQFNAEGFYQIPVEMVLTDCRSTPDAKLTDILKQHSN